MQQFAAMLHQFADMLSTNTSGDPLNWDLAKDLARHVVAEQGDPAVLENERRTIVDALRLADLWLDQATSLPSGVRTPQAWSRSEWIENTLPVWSKVCNPIAARMVDSMGSSMGPDMPADVQAMAGPLLGMIRQMAGVMVGGQAGQALGALAKEVVGSADVGLPLAPEGVAALLPAGVAAFGEGLEVPLEDVRLYMALREAAHQRLFAHVPWLRPALLGAVEDYARGITVDLSHIEGALSGVDVNDPEAIQNALGSELSLQPEETPQQKAALARLETALALVEGWVDTVVNAAAADRLPSATKLAEAVRRRRATGGPAERTFATLVGLELRPRRLREAAALWSLLGEVKGIDERDNLWSHPDLMPTGEDLDDPEGFVNGRSDEIDISALEEPKDPEDPEDPPKD
jgi:putative hydrolase